MDKFIQLFPGVPLFFFVSGFLITDSYINSKNLKEYFIKRCMRIYPALFVNILLLEIAMYLGGNLNEVSIFQYTGYFILYVITAASGIAGTIFDLKNNLIYNYSGFFSSYPSGVLWTLSVELSFYFVLPFILNIRKITYRNLLLVFLFCISLVVPIMADKDFYQASNLNKLLELICLPFLWIFIIGILMRLYWSVIRKYLVGYGLYYVAFYLIFCYMFGNEISDYKRNLNFITILQIVFLAFAMVSLAFSYTNFKILRQTDLSYSVYLYHMLVVQILISFNFNGSLYLYFIVLLSTIVIAYFSWVFIEKPVLNLKKIEDKKCYKQ